MRCVEPGSEHQRVDRRQGSPWHCIQQQQLHAQRLPRNIQPVISPGSQSSQAGPAGSTAATDSGGLNARPAAELWQRKVESAAGMRVIRLTQVGPLSSFSAGATSVPRASAYARKNALPADVLTKPAPARVIHARVNNRLGPREIRVAAANQPFRGRYASNAFFAPDAAGWPHRARRTDVTPPLHNMVGSLSQRIPGGLGIQASPPREGGSAAMEPYVSTLTHNNSNIPSRLGAVDSETMRSKPSRPDEKGGAGRRQGAPS